ncbi:MAG: hypothetical protein IKI57_03075 [Clostridia bacterium]|nr:hypothetical protein [Clostridia bacterium]
MSINGLSNILHIVCWIFYMIQVPRMLHIMQQESYQNDGMYRWITKNPKKAFKRPFIICVIVVAVFMATAGIMIILPKGATSVLAQNSFYRFVPSFMSIAAFVIGSVVLFIKEHKERKEAKKPLKYTARAKRLVAYNFCVLVILQVFLMQSLPITYPKEIQNNLSSRYVSARESEQLVNCSADQKQRISDYYTTLDNTVLKEEDQPIINNLNEIIIDQQKAYEYDLERQLMYIAIMYAFLLFTLPLNMVIANWFASPLERRFQENYMKKAYKKLHSEEYKNLIKIGITGSYGKTSTKYILKTLLEEKYKVLATPGSYNTSMGNVRVIREQLLPEHEVFISEMGARKKRDIREICEFVEPQIGIITSIGEQHLETFKTIDNIVKTKAELLTGTKNKKVNVYSPYVSVWQSATAILKKQDNESAHNGLLEDGAVFLPKDGSYCEELYKLDSHDNKFLYSTSNNGADIYAKDIKANKEGSTFTIVSKKNGTYECKTKLLGEHNVQNIVGAVAIAEYLGLDKNQIQKGIEKIEPVEHRLQILPSTNGTTVIDDAFNSNPVGSKAALEVIKQFEGRKIIVTPGMVELGQEEANLNKEFGRQMAEAVDIAILVGPKHTKPIEEGLKEKGFDDMAIYVVKSLDDATKTLGRISKKGDVILFENDLPDSYNE